MVVLMDAFQIQPTDVDEYTCFFEALAYCCVSSRFPFFNLAAGEFPEPAERRVRRPPTNKNPPLGFDDSDRDRRWFRQ